MKRSPIVIFIPAEGFNPESGVNELSRTCTLRLFEGMGVYKRALGQNIVIVVTGGLFASRREQTRSAGSLMEDWLAERGVPLSDIVVEDKSVDTYENIAFSIKALEANNIDPKTASIIVVSERLHNKRITHTFKAAHGIEVSTCDLPDRPGLFRWITDRFLVFYHWWDTYGDGWLARTSRASRHNATKS